MEHNGTEYSVVSRLPILRDGNGPPISKGRKPKTGISYNRALAIAAAKVALESAIKVKRRAKPMTQ